MKSANIAELKNHLSDYLRLVERGEKVEVSKRNVPFARIVPLPKKKKNRTTLGALAGSVGSLGAFGRCDCGSEDSFLSHVDSVW